MVVVFLIFASLHINSSNYRSMAYQALTNDFEEDPPERHRGDRGRFNLRHGHDPLRAYGGLPWSQFREQRRNWLEEGPSTIRELSAWPRDNAQSLVQHGGDDIAHRLQYWINQCGGFNLYGVSKRSALPTDPPKYKLNENDYQIGIG